MRYIIEESVKQIAHYYEGQIDAEVALKRIGSLMGPEADKQRTPFDPTCESVTSVGELRRILDTFDENDCVVLESTDKHGDVGDLYKFYVDVIDGLTMLDGSKIREIRFTQIQHHQTK